MDRGERGALMRGALARGDCGSLVGLLDQGGPHDHNSAIITKPRPKPHNLADDSATTRGMTRSKRPRPAPPGWIQHRDVYISLLFSFFKVCHPGTPPRAGGHRRRSEETGGHHPVVASAAVSDG